MIWPSPIFSKLWPLVSLATVACGATVTGQVALVDSHNRSLPDSSAAVVWLVPVATDAVADHTTLHARMLQKDKHFEPHILPIEVGTLVDFPNLDPIFHNAFSNFDGQLFDIGLYPPGSTRSIRFRRPGLVRVFCNIHPAMSAVIVVLPTPYYATTNPQGRYALPEIPAGQYELHIFQERATPETLGRLTQTVTVAASATDLGTVTISDAGYIPVPHKTNMAKTTLPTMPAATTSIGLSLLWRILLATSLALVSLFTITTFVVQRYAVSATEASLENEVRTSAQAYHSLWTARTQTLAAVSRIISSMSDVRAAFLTQDKATIRDSAEELWSRISQRDAIFVVLSPTGNQILALNGHSHLPVLSEDSVAAARKKFPAQVSGYLSQNGRLFYVVLTPVYVQAGAGQGLLNILMAGLEIDNNLAASLKNSTRGSDFVFLMSEKVVASTLPLTDSKNWQQQPQRPAELKRFSADGVEFLSLGSILDDAAGQPIGELRVIRSLAGARHTINRLERNIIFLWLAAACFGLLLTYLLARRILLPVRQLDQAALQVSQQNYAYRVPVNSRDELGRLALTFNQMCDSIQSAREELIRQERITTIGRLSSSIVHDLRNPLAAIYGGAEILVDSELPPAQAKRLALSIYKASRRIQELLQDLSNISRGKSGVVELCRLTEVIEAALELLTPAADAQRVHVILHIPAEIELPLERARVERLFLNLLNNALEAMPAGGQLTVTAARMQDSALIQIDDTGLGLSKNVREKLFQPFVSEGKRNGLGLGLALSRQTAIDHGGDLWAEDKPTPGARFCISLPLPGPPPDP